MGRPAGRPPGWPDDRGSSTAEFTLVAALLTVLTLSVLQLGLALHIRNTTLDAAAEGARVAALADNGLADGAERTRDLLRTALGSTYAGDVSATRGDYLGMPSVAVTVRAPLPVLGLVGVEGGLEVTGHAVVEEVG
ncbi:TadE/TadG family type IV pilus assembly protein [Marisediminicola senii]|uniref:TadE/TadG family type IV pilus assembly protein n=1 Tax=Marisediminicola senii TaxID=2711233 RepID=UPI0013ECB5CA|nr:TadE/TadG family type IV pilus assembly protein [Marisediminicola senii]